MKPWFSASAALLLSACLAYGSGGNTLAKENNVETLYRVDVTPSNLIVRVLGQGCTRREDFALVQVADSPITLRVDRLRPDHCRARRQTYTITLSFDDLPQASRDLLAAGASFQLQNPLAPLPAHLRERPR